jgi:putative peptide zinc metalloprotease protein
MRFDGYYVMADWLEIPNLRDRSNKYLSRLVQEHCLGIELQPEPYMSTGRKVLFISYAIVSWIYRWVVTFSILYFLYRFLEPYKLGAVSTLLAAAAAGSMVGWPLYRLGKNIHRRGRLPDMKSNRVWVCVLVLAAVVAAFFFLPLPVSRVRDIGMVQVQPEYQVKVYAPSLPNTGMILDRLHVLDGQPVKKDQPIAEFRSVDVENQMQEARGQVEINKKKIQALREQKDSTNDLQERSRIEASIASETKNLAISEISLRDWEDQAKLMVLRSPRDGVVMSCPKKDEVGKLWEKEQSAAFCTVGDPTKLQALLPVVPADHRLLKEELAKNRDLPVTIRVQGFADRTWQGRIDLLQESEAKEVPPQLTTKFGGPLAVRPTQQGGGQVPQSQHFLVSINFLQPDVSIHPGTLARVKIHCQWRSCAWWLWRTVSSTFNLGLI